jgi:hypothetical protein
LARFKRRFEVFAVEVVPHQTRRLRLCLLDLF